MTSPKPTSPESREELAKQVRELINERPYYICKVSDEHKDLQSQFGSMIGQYSRREDKLNEEYLESYFVDFVLEKLTLQKQQLLDAVERDVIGSDVEPNMHPNLLRSNQEAQNRLRHHQRTAINKLREGLGGV